MKSVHVMAAGAAFVLAVTACSGIRLVRASKTGGEIALVGDRESAMEKARAEMARICGGPDSYEVVEEGEAVVGEVSDSHGSATGGKSMFGNPTVRTSEHSETTQKTEWRVKFACKGAQPPAPSDGAPATKPEAGKPAGQLRQVVVRF